MWLVRDLDHYIQELCPNSPGLPYTLRYDGSHPEPLGRKILQYSIFNFEYFKVRRPLSRDLSTVCRLLSGLSEFALRRHVRLILKRRNAGKE